MKRAEEAVKHGTKLARKVFEKRGNHSEAHLEEAELAALLSLAYEEGWVKGEKAMRQAIDEALNSGDGTYKP